VSSVSERLSRSWKVSLGALIFYSQFGCWQWYRLLYPGNIGFEAWTSVRNDISSRLMCSVSRGGEGRISRKSIYTYDNNTLTAAQPLLAATNYLLSLRDQSIHIASFPQHVLSRLLAPIDVNRLAPLKPPKRIFVVPHQKGLRTSKSCSALRQ